MSHHPIDELIELWKREKLTSEQVIGQMLQLLRDHERRLREVGRRLPASAPGVDEEQGGPALARSRSTKRST